MACKSSSSDSESVDWHPDKDLLPTVENFHKLYAMPPEKLKGVKMFHEDLLNKFFDYVGFCTDVKKIGGSYEGVKIVKSEENDDFEFDVMFVLKIPELYHLEIVEIPGRHGYALLKVRTDGSNTPEFYRELNHRIFTECLTDENDMRIVDAGKTTSAFFGALQKWINTKPIQGFKLLPRQHGTAIQMDVIREQIGENMNQFFYSVDIAPTFEIWEGREVKRYVAKPDKKRTPDSVTWRRLFDYDKSESDQEEHARNILRSAVEELNKQLSEYCASCEGLCQGSCVLLESARTCMPLPEHYILRLQAALVGRESSYRLTFINLQDLKRSTNKRLVAIGYSFNNELQVLPVPEMSGYAWLKHQDESSVSSRLSNASKLCYLPGGKYLDIKAASDMLVKELQEIANDLFKNEDTVVRRDGPIVRIDVYPEKGNKMLYFYLDIVLAAYVDSNFYTGLPHDYDDVPDKKAWRRSYSYEETTKIQEAPEGLKMVFRVLKAIRNGECGLAQLTSYHFKSLLLNMQELKTVYWNENIDKILIRVLQHLRVCLKKKELPTYFIPEINLLENMINDSSAHMLNRIDQLLENKRKMFKALKNPITETTDDVLRQHKNESTQAFLESVSVQGYFYGGLRSQLLAEINKQLFGYDHTTITSKPVYEDITVYRLFPNEVQGLTNCHAMMLIHNNNKNLRACQYNLRVIRLERCNSTVSTSLLQTVSHNSGLADTRKTAQYIKQQMEKLINKSSLLRENVSVHLEGSNIVLKSNPTARDKSNSDLQVNILPGYEVGEEFFIDMPEVPGTNAWIPIPFTPVRNKFWKAFNINECGRKVLSDLKGIQDRERSLTQLSESHLLMAIFWEMEIERDWSDDKVTERVHDVLDRLFVCIKKKNLPNYFDPTSNTL